MVSVGVRPLPVSLDMMHQLTRLIASAASIRGCDVCYLTAYEQETEVGEEVCGSTALLVGEDWIFEIENPC